RPWGGDLRLASGGHVTRRRLGTFGLRDFRAPGVARARARGGRVGAVALHRARDAGVPRAARAQVVHLAEFGPFLTESRPANEQVVRRGTAAVGGNGSVAGV